MDITNPFTLQTLQDRVKRGAALLDEKHPGWAEKIDKLLLDMNDCYDCVLGQLYGEYFDGREALGLTHGWYHGFDNSVNTDISPSEELPVLAVYEHLNTLWIAEINQRLSKPSITD